MEVFLKEIIEQLFHTPNLYQRIQISRENPPKVKPSEIYFLNLKMKFVSTDLPAMEETNSCKFAREMRDINGCKALEI